MDSGLGQKGKVSPYALSHALETVQIEPEACTITEQEGKELSSIRLKGELNLKQSQVWGDRDPRGCQAEVRKG